MRYRSVGIRSGSVLAAVSLALAAGCSPRYYRADADREVYGVLSHKQAGALGEEPPFSIEADLADPLESLRRGGPSSAPAPPASISAFSEDRIGEIPADGVPRQSGAVLVTLRDALRTAARHSREYQSRKETLYLAALDLTLERHQWKPQLSGILTGDATVSDAADSAGAGSSFGMSQLLALGGEVTINIATDFVKYTSGGLDNVAASALAVHVLQPLWRNAGRLVARENLTQAERDTVYAVRSFARFRKAFCYEITSEYYGVLRQRDAASNEWQNYLRVRQSVTETAWRAAKGDLRTLEVDQARQDQLAAWDRWLQAVRRYQEGLDRFKVRLTLPAGAAIELDPNEVTRLRQEGPREVPVAREQAVRTALRRRFDLANRVAEVADAERKVILAANGLAPDVDLTVDVNVASDDRRPLRVELSRGTYSGGLEAGLPLNRKAERNAYRRSLIDLESARRAADAHRDEVTLEVREAWRSLLETAARYRTQEESLRLAERRVKGERLALDTGRAKMRDLLEALRAQLSAENALTSALIDHALARLAFWRDTELLEVDQDGIWQEPTDVQTQD